MKSLKLIQQHREQEHFIETHQNLQPFDLRKILSQLTSHYSEVDFEIIGEGKVYADQAIFSVFDNLISNAIKHGKASKIFIKIQNKNGNCEIIFQDNGQGIDQQYQQKIFEKGKSFGKTGNTGLGLHIVKQCLEQYGGRVFLADSDTSGACFFIKLPKVLID
jgi:signal transduction histidine kinase